MADFPAYDETNAPEGSRAILDGAKRSLGFVPNLYGAFAGSPAALEGYTAISNIINERSSFDAAERQIVRIAASAENGCTYCVAAESTIAGMQKVDADTIAALRDERPLPNAKHEALRRFTLAVIRDRGWVNPNDLAAFLSAGYTHASVLDVILIVAQKTLSNYTNHVVDTQLDAAFQPQAWSKPTVAAQ